MPEGFALPDMLRRAQGGRTQADVAEELGTTESTYSRWIHGIKVPSDRFAPAIAGFVGLSVTEVRRMLYRQRQALGVLDRLAVLEATVDTKFALLEQYVDALQAQLDQLRGVTPDGREDPPPKRARRRRVAS